MTFRVLRVLHVCGYFALGLTPGLTSAGVYKLDNLLQGDVYRAAATIAVPSETAQLSDAVQDTLRVATEAFTSGNHSRAQALAQQVVDAAPQSGDGWYILGLALANSGQFTAALEALETADSHYSSNTQPLVAMGDILSFLNRDDEAWAAYAMAAERDLSRWQLHERLARMAASKGDLEDAVERYQMATLHGPVGRMTPHLELAQLFVEHGFNDLAIGVMDAFVKTVPDNLKAQAALGHIQRLAGQPDQAITTFLSIYRKSTDEPSAAINLAQTLSAERRFDEALDVLSAMAAKLQPNIDLQLEIGQVFAAKRDYQNALAAYVAGLELAPRDFELLKSASIANRRLGRFDKALGYAEQLVALRPENPTDHMWLATLNQEAGHDTDAIAAYEAALKFGPDNWIAQNSLAVLLTATDPDKAEALAAKAFAAAPDVLVVKETLGWAKYTKGDLPGALSIFQDLRTVQPLNASYALRLGQILTSMEQSQDARTALEDAARLDGSLVETVQSMLEEL